MAQGKPRPAGIDVSVGGQEIALGVLRRRSLGHSRRRSTLIEMRQNGSWFYLDHKEHSYGVYAARYVEGIHTFKRVAR